MANEKQAKCVYPQVPEKITGYSYEWIHAYLTDNIESIPMSKLKHYKEQVGGKKLPAIRKIFYDTFINEPSKHDEFIDGLIKQKAESSGTENKTGKKRGRKPKAEKETEQAAAEE